MDIITIGPDEIRSLISMDDAIVAVREKIDVFDRFGGARDQQHTRFVGDFDRSRDAVSGRSRFYRDDDRFACAGRARAFRVRAEPTFGVRSALDFGERAVFRRRRTPRAGAATTSEQERRADG